MKKWKIVLNPIHGYYEVSPKPSIKELQNYYGNLYFQEEKSTYAHSYDKNEILYFQNKIIQKSHVIEKIINPIGKKKILDVGCGEGFSLNYFYNKGWLIKGLDFSSSGIKNNNPHLFDYVIFGDIFQQIEKLIDNKELFDVIWLDNILEHVREPEYLLELCYKLTENNGVLVIEVPNDFSEFQNFLVDREIVSKKYWVAFPDHLSYFSYKSLVCLCESKKWNLHTMLIDFPIEWYLMNKKSNYIANDQLGKSAHQARIFFENFLHENIDNPDELNLFYESMAKIGMGRQLIGFFVKE